ncbi:hypothetical protein A7K93_09965 [Candidatus Methylacidiphilum fumarolicum]|uniref:Uncharacterized protein n=2 Tax=Candidatus Methylacidiphilum fumarolicum TaxID=591154 RepID=I0JVB0_METFB|nr:hypothetical protein [Candidatus Methylacidiphilum fumarolicum]MBW6415994.1 hypothetical protein [Candidatus Methylacidiphilum fumarolicum]TFE66039.1 hypothetical protein A7K73_10825 [Candidatus Methylacidiphilum fumarolicum]TFE71901.1 hypothetical protein A7K93_09965 [Candidatus Methylacidiphilum fumarolicum]TFE73032.1 hypothetical protein A7K72_07420 [Candidatus Methylacidiphilum fumarolicum]TFE76252.1 hypothetical protein A7D33_10610 [Candidatus Methylacidiphilum fumarolicum]
MKNFILRVSFFICLLALAWFFSELLISYVQQETSKKLNMEKEYEQAQNYIQRVVKQEKKARDSKIWYESRVKQNTETILIDVLSRFQRQRNDFRLLSIFHDPMGIGIRAEARSGAIVQFLEFCSDELPDFTPVSIVLTPPSINLNAGALNCEFIYKRNSFEQSQSKMIPLKPMEKTNEKIQFLSPFPSLKK